MTTAMLLDRTTTRSLPAVRAALLTAPSPLIERERPLPGEPGAVFERAQEQHAVLVARLRALGVRVTVLDAADVHAVAVARLAVPFADGLYLMRPASPVLRAAARRVEALLRSAGVPLCGAVDATGLLDGGDILVVGERVFVASSPRGDANGREAFARAARERGYDVVEVVLPDDAPPLRAVCNAVSARMVIAAPDLAGNAAFSGLEIMTVDRGERFAAGLFTLGERRVIVDLRYRTALRSLRDARVAVEALDLYEFEKLGITPSQMILPLPQR